MLITGVELQETTKYLEEERAKADELHDTVQRLETEGRESSEKIVRLTASERSLTDKTRDQASLLSTERRIKTNHSMQERELHEVNIALNELRSQSEQHQRRARELEEQMQNDDRVERLEATLQDTQDRAAELEFQVSKLKQVWRTVMCQ